QAEKAQKRATIAILNKDQSRREVPSGDTNPAALAHQTFEQVLDFALPRGGDRVELSVGPQKSTLSVQIDGMRHPQDEPDPKVALAMVDYLKDVAGMEVSDRRRRQTGSVMIDAGDLGRHSLGLSTSGSTKGLSLTIEIDPEKRSARTLPALGLLSSQMKQLEAA